MIFKRKWIPVLVGCAVLGMIFWAGVGQLEAGHGRGYGKIKYKVSLTNVTPGQIFSPAVVYTHGDCMPPLFKLGQPSSAELAGLAEDALLDPVVLQAAGSPHVKDVVVLKGVDGPIKPGETASIIVEASWWAPNLTLAGMLVTTNDAFYALNGSRGPIFKEKEKEFYLQAYDAGSEANLELCAHIPGPPCGNPGVHAPGPAEGFVHVHSGIHGIGDLAPSEFDWKNPVAVLKVKRIGH